MNFTREPIIETVITPKEGSKLVVRSSKGSEREEYLVDAIEIINFGNSIFFRSTERPNSFLVPAADYEVVELKEAKMILKNATIDKSIKIGGGKSPEEDKSQRRKKLIKRKQHDLEVKPPVLESEKGGGSDDETQVSSSILRKLFPPPPNLIKEKLASIKSAEKIDESVSEELVKGNGHEAMAEEKSAESFVPLKEEIEKKEE
ncbi:MAG: hypothetical protein WCT85_05710 [Parachlamydiales bacterium]